MKIRVKHLRHDNYKTTLEILITAIHAVVIEPTFIQVSADVQPSKVFYWVYLLWKAKLTLHFGESENKV